jgi:hypothetical protein
MTAVTSATFPATEVPARLSPSSWLRAALLAALAATGVVLLFDLTVAAGTIDRAVALEDHHGASAVPELFSRGEQRGGLVTGLLLYGTGIAFLVAGAAVFAARRWRVAARTLWLAVVGTAAWSIAILPALAAPPLPPGLEVDLGIGARQGLYVGVVVTGVVLVTGAFALGRTVRRRALRVAFVVLALLASAGAALYAFPEQRVLGDLPDVVLRDFRLAVFFGQALFWSALALAGYLALGRRHAS